MTGSLDEERRHMNCWLGRRPGDSRPAPVETALLEGRFEEARALLDGGAANGWAGVYRAAAAFQAGELEGALAHAEALIRSRPKSACGGALAALILAARGDRPGAQARLQHAASLGPAAWVLGLRGTLRARWGELEEARADLNAAAAGEPSSWILLERAEVLNRLGLFVPALADLDRARRLMPGAVEPDLRAAAFHLDQAQYAQAKRRLSRVLALRPSDPEAWAGRARVAMVEGDLRAAHFDLSRACRLAPGDGRLLEGRLRLELMLGRYAAARRSLRGLSGAAREHWQGYLLCRLGRYAESRARFESAARLDPSRSNSAFYAQVARSLGERRAPRRSSAARRLTIMGLGYRQPFQVSREALFAMRDCQVMYSNLSDSSVADFLGLFPAPFRAIVFRRRDQQSTRCARDVMPAFKRFKRVAVVTRGHPLYYGRLAYRLVKDCGRLGIEVRVPGSVSISDTIIGMAEHSRSETLGLQVRDSASLSRLDSRLPLVLYNLSSRAEERGRLSRELAALFPSGHSCVLLAGSGDGEFSPVSSPLDALGAALGRADEAVTLMLPAAAS
jgi:tetratricopeptide (TPR) repeat protein